jgi:hypothetical protein
MADDFLPDSASFKRSVENSCESSDEGGYRFLFYDSPKKEKVDKKKNHSFGAPVKLDLHESELRREIMEVHSEEGVRKRVEEYDEMIKDIEANNENDINKS